jgi:hypothetical protein
MMSTYAGDMMKKYGVPFDVSKLKSVRGFRYGDRVLMVCDYDFLGGCPAHRGDVGTVSAIQGFKGVSISPDPGRRMLFVNWDDHGEHSIGINCVEKIVGRKNNPMINVHPLAIEARKRYRDDLKAGHTDATEYWRGQAGAFFTGNPLGSPNPYVSGYPSRYPVIGDIVRFAGMDRYGTVAHVSKDGERVMVYWGEGAMEAKPVESSRLVLVSRSGGQNPLAATIGAIGAGVISGIGMATGFKVVDGAVRKAKSVIKNPRTLPPLMRGTMEKTYDCGCVYSGTPGRTRFCPVARGLLGQQVKVQKAYKRTPTLENMERLTRADLAFEKHYHFRRTSA